MKKSESGKEAAVFTLKFIGFSILFTAIFLLLAVSGYFVAKDVFLDTSLYVNRESDTQSSFSGLTVIIDPGHGGEDSGAVSDGGVLEKELNLQIASKIVEFLKLYRVESVMTREDDKMLYSEGDTSKKRGDLKGRVEFARQYENALFVSIHMNKFSIPKYSGLQVFYSKNNPQSEAVAIKLQEDVKKYLQNENNRIVKAADSNIFVLDRLTCPAVLVECGFLSNYDETKLLQDEEYQNKLAFVIASSLIEYLNV